MKRKLLVLFNKVTGHLDAELFFSIKNKDIDSIGNLIALGANIKPRCILLAVGAGCPDCLSLLLENGGDPNAGDGAALNMASLKGKPNLLKILLSSPSLPERSLRSAIRLASRSEHPDRIECVKLLREYGAPRDDSAISHARRNNHRDAYRALTS